MDILRRYQDGEKAVDIAKSVGLAATTVRTIRDRDGDKIREAAKSATTLDAKTMTRTRSALMMKMESSTIFEYNIRQIYQKVFLRFLVQNHGKHSAARHNDTGKGCIVHKSGTKIQQN